MNIVFILEYHHEDYPLHQFVAYGHEDHFGLRQRAEAELRRRGWVCWLSPTGKPPPGAEHPEDMWVPPSRAGYTYSIREACEHELGLPKEV